MPTLDDIESNELPIIAFENGQVSVWRAWKRAISAFHDPALWQDTAKFHEYFERLDTDEWGMAGYGMIVVDFDRKKVVSLNDYSSPSLLVLPMDNLILSAEDPAPRALLELLKDPSQWPYVSLRVAPSPGLAGFARALVSAPPSAPVPQTFTLDAIIDPSRTPEENFSALTIRHAELDIQGKSYWVSEGRYLPLGWTEVAQHELDLVDVMSSLKEAGFPAPRWDLMDGVVQEQSEMFEDEEEQERGSDAYEEIKASWGAPVSRPSPKP